MNVITISREYGAGGGEVARRLADLLKWELLDRELLHQAAALEHLPDAELERLDEKAVSLADRFRLHPTHQRYIHGLTEAARQAARRGHVVLVGRGLRHLLGDWPGAFHLRLVAPREWRAQRMALRESWSAAQALAKCLEVERTRARFLRYFFGHAAVSPEQYDLVVNSGRVPLEVILEGVAAAVRESADKEWPGADAAKGQATETGGSGAARLLTLAPELGAGDTGFARTLAVRLKLRVYDPGLLDQEAQGLGLTGAEVEQIDEQPSGIFERFRPRSIHQRCFETMGQITQELAERGNVLLVGRGGSRFWKDQASALHVRLVAPMDKRIRRVMEHYWLREEGARSLITQSDTQRRRFYSACFGADWADPLEYHLTLNTGRLGPLAVDLLAFFAQRHWDGTAAGTAAPRART